MYRTIDFTTYDPQAFFQKASMGDGCWKWLGSKYRNGYGKLGKTGVMAHRIAYELTRGEVPKDMCLDHLCKQRDCINPDHLEIVTLTENVMRGESQAAQNGRKTHCIRGHEFTSENTYTPPKRQTRRYCKTCASIRSQYKNKNSDTSQGSGEERRIKL